MLNISLIIFIIYASFSFAQNTRNDTMKEVSTIGIFDGKKTRIGNFEVIEVYKINNYCISPDDISESLSDSLKGKKIFVTGYLKIVKGKTFPPKTSFDGKIYEPYKEPDKIFITNPVFTIVYDSREPLLEK